MINKPVLAGLAATAVVVAGGLGFVFLRGNGTTAPTTAPPPAAAALPATAPAVPAAASAEPGPPQVTAANRREYFLQCRPCHSVTQPDGTVTMLGSGLGADLYGIIDRPAALQDGFAYSDSMREAAAKGLVWTVENILVYAANPKEFLRAQTGDPKAEGTMVYKLIKGQDALITYLRAVGPQP